MVASEGSADGAVSVTAGVVALVGAGGIVVRRRRRRRDGRGDVIWSADWSEAGEAVVVVRLVAVVGLVVVVGVVGSSLM